MPANYSSLRHKLNQYRAILRQARRTIKLQRILCVILALIVIALACALVVKSHGVRDTNYYAVPSALDNASPPLVKISEPTRLEYVAPVSDKEPVSEPTSEPICAQEPVAAPNSDLAYIGQYRLTAYCSCDKCCDTWAYNRPYDENGQPIILTASGDRAVEGVTVAVNPEVIPYGTILVINGHEFIAQDTGSACQNNNIIDVYFSSHEAALQFGIQYADVYVKLK